MAPAWCITVDYCSGGPGENFRCVYKKIGGNVLVVVSFLISLLACSVWSYPAIGPGGLDIDILLPLLSRENSCSSSTINTRRSGQVCWLWCLLSGFLASLRWCLGVMTLCLRKIFSYV